jgi:hypothetical protein
VLFGVLVFFTLGFLASRYAGYVQLCCVRYLLSPFVATSLVVSSSKDLFFFFWFFSFFFFFCFYVSWDPGVSFDRLWLGLLYKLCFSHSKAVVVTVVLRCGGTWLFSQAGGDCKNVVFETIKVLQNYERV